MAENSCGNLPANPLERILNKVIVQPEDRQPSAVGQTQARRPAHAARLCCRPRSPPSFPYPVSPAMNKMKHKEPPLCRLRNAAGAAIHDASLRRAVQNESNLSAPIGFVSIRQNANRTQLTTCDDMVRNHKNKMEKTSSVYAQCTSERATPRAKYLHSYPRRRARIKLQAADSPIPKPLAFFAPWRRLSLGRRRANPTCCLNPISLTTSPIRLAQTYQ